MRLILAPMEGLIDAPMRELFGRLGGYDFAISEFIRVTEQRLPRRTLLRLCPELNNGGQTRSGLPVWPQLLGSHPDTLARTAVQLAELGAPGIDLNFGCPSNAVNRKDGGAILLREPQRIHHIIATVRQALPAEVPLSAKIRLGYEDTALAIDNALAIEAAGVQQLTVHARTRADGYHAPARWEWLAILRENIAIPLIANGDIRSVEDYRRCHAISGCKDMMIGRAAVGSPDLARQIRLAQQGTPINRMAWDSIAAMVLEMGRQLQTEMADRHVASRIKQWLALLRPFYPQAEECFIHTRQVRHFSEMTSLLQPSASSSACSLQPNGRIA